MSSADCRGSRIPVSDLIRAISSSGLLWKIWPADRVLLGLAACSWLRKELLPQIDDVILLAAKMPSRRLTEDDKEAWLYEVFQSGSIAQAFKRLSKNQVRMRCVGLSTEQLVLLLEGISFAASSGWLGGQLVQLSLALSEEAERCVDETLQHLGASMAPCSNLTHLDLPGLGITYEGVELLASALTNCTKLRTLVLSDNDIQDRGIESVSKIVQACTSLSKLHLENTAIHHPDVLASAVRECFSLTDLNVASNPISNEGLSHLATALTQNRTLALVDLNFSHCDLNVNFIYIDARLATLDASDVLVQLFDRHCRTLSRINLSGNEFNTDHRYQRLLASLAKCTALRAVALSVDMLPPSGLSVLSRSLQAWGELQELELSDTSMGDVGAGLLARGLAGCKPMRRLTLRGNMIEDQGAMDLAEPMRLFSELEFLDLGGNLVQADGAGRLAEGLRECRKLRHLDLNCNSIGVAGTESVAQLLGEWPALEYLDVACNSLEDGGACALAAYLSACQRLLHLDVRLNKIQEDGAGCLGDSIGCCVRLQTLDVGGNYIGAGGMEKLARGLQGCVALESLHLFACGIGPQGFLALTAVAGDHLKSRLVDLDAGKNGVRLGDGDRTPAEVEDAIGSWESIPGLRLRV